MKCTNCGKNNAMYHYRFEMNGEAQEAHLCADCAAKLRPEREFAVRTHELFGDMFSDSFFGGSLFDERPTRGLPGGFFGHGPLDGFPGGVFMSPFALLGMPRIEISFPQAPSGNAEQSVSAGRSGVDPELSKRREINALREQMRAAAEAEDYEQAAKLRDKLRDMEK